VQKRTYQIGPSTLILEFGDLTTSSADVLVSSDDSYLTMGGGVSAAILRAAGESLLRDAAKKVPARLGDVVVTTAGALEAKYVFHAITIGKGELTPEEVLTLATSRCLELLRTLRLKSIAFPALGAGAAGFAYQDVARRMVNVIVESLKDDQEPLDVTIFLYDRFRRMQPIDYVDFFETIAAHLSHLAPATLKAKRRLRAAPSATTRGPRIAKQERREEADHATRRARSRTRTTRGEARGIRGHSLKAGAGCDPRATSGAAPGTRSALNHPEVAGAVTCGLGVRLVLARRREAA
jgi:O-acetyl-ADP-ribose deacetylase (regulator of RNase III)